jgi:biopolymer transport protein TolR
MSMATGSGSTKFNSDINVTPMVDIMLVLLIIFMVITPLLQQGVTITLPKNLNNPEEDKNIINKASVVVVITADDKLYIGKDPIQKDQLVDRIQKIMEDPAHKELVAKSKEGGDIVYIRSDVNARYGTVVDVINLIRQAGIEQIGLVADKKKGGGKSTGAPDINAPLAKPATS